MVHLSNDAAACDSRSPRRRQRTGPSRRRQPRRHDRSRSRRPSQLSSFPSQIIESTDSRPATSRRTQVEGVGRVYRRQGSPSAPLRCLQNCHFPLESVPLPDFRWRMSACPVPSESGTVLPRLSPFTTKGANLPRGSLAFPPTRDRPGREPARLRLTRPCVDHPNRVPLRFRHQLIAPIAVELHRFDPACSEA